MKRNAIMEQSRELITPEIKEDVDFAIAIVDRIFDILEKNKITQRELAIRLKKSEAEISHWMKGTHNFTLSTIKKIEKALGEPILIVAGTQIPTYKYKTLTINNTMNFDNIKQSYSPSIQITLDNNQNILVSNTSYQC